MKEKVVCFAGHRFEWHNINIDEKLEKTIITLIKKGYTTFFNADYGYFDELASSILCKLKKTYSHIKIYKILTYYNPNKKQLPAHYTESILPDLSMFHYKQKIIKRNEWIVDNSDILICHIIHSNNSGAYTMVKYAQSKNLPIIYI